MSAVETMAREATEKRFALRLASEDQRNGYEVGWFEGYTAARTPTEDAVERVATAKAAILRVGIGGGSTFDAEERDEMAQEWAEAVITALDGDENRSRAQAMGEDG